MATKPKGKKLNASPVQPQSAAPTNPTLTQLALLRTLQDVMQSNWHTQAAIETAAEKLLTTNGGGILMDNPQREVWEHYFYTARDHRRLLRSQLDHLDCVIWRTEKGMTASVDTLQDWYANAKVTTSCGGHKKSDRNEALAKSWLAELEARGLRPDGRAGCFNGDGAS